MTMHNTTEIPVYGSQQCSTAQHHALHRALLSAAAKAQSAQLDAMRERRRELAVTGTRRLKAATFLALD